MPIFAHPIPLSLYIHIPWCVKKCPYCDFNSHTLRDTLPEAAYINALLTDLSQDLQQFAISERELQSIFIGGGTPSLLSPEWLKALLNGIRQQLRFSNTIEITLEANPGTVEQDRYKGFRKAGINRLSLGIQSFNPEKLKALGRIHDGRQAIDAVHGAQQAGFSNINLDLMYGLPQQITSDALSDLEIALSLNPTHISWYQLTLEPNTAFYHRPPPLPNDDLLWEMQQKGQMLLAKNGFYPYEISAYTRKSPNLTCQHNLNYWQFGDYLGIGAGAHGKITNLNTGLITRTWKTKHPKDYLANKPLSSGERTLICSEIPLEFMLNALRLYQPVTWELFEQRTGLNPTTILPHLQKAASRGLLIYNTHTISTTPMGKRYLNDVLQIFL